LPMKTFQILAIVIGLMVAFLGLFFGLYALMTMGQRRTTREIRRAALARGWRYRLRRWQGNPTAFRIDGRTQSGLTWIATSGNSGQYERRWSTELAVRFPMLAGEVDFALVPREPEVHDSALPRPAIPAGVEARLASLSGAAGSAVGFLQNACELPTGDPSFDAAYQVFALPRRGRVPPVNAVLAERMLRWPSGAVAPHSVLVWRDPFGLHCRARLLAPPNWATVSYFLGVAEDCSECVPPGMSLATPPTLLDRMITRLLR
jgi:hypothetical protein